MIRQFLAVIKENRKNVFWASVIFIGSAILGYLFFNESNQYIRAIFAQIENIASDIKEKDSVLFMIYTIFANNLSVAVRMILLGAIFGVIPILILFSNGLFIGFLMKKLVIESGQSISFFLVGILPHGILELPAIVISAAIGMGIGFQLFNYIVAVIKKKNRKYYQLALWYRIKQIPIAILGLTIILFLAAIVESTVTGYLLSKM